VFKEVNLPELSGKNKVEGASMSKGKFFMPVMILLFVGLSSVYGAGGQQAATGGPYTPPKDMLFVCGGGVGGGQDTFVRMVLQALNTSGVYTGPIAHENWTGGGGLVCIQRVNETMTGRGDILESGSGAITPIEVGNNTKLRQTDLTAVAGLVLETMSMVVSINNKELDTMDKFLAKLRSDPTSINFGGNLPPGEDYLTLVMICNTLGIDYKQLNYVYYDGSGEVLPALLGGHIDVSFSGTAEWAAPIEAGQLKCIAVASEQRVGGLYKDAPTFKEKGVDFVWQNWRGVLGPREMPKDALDYWRATFKKLTETPQWKEICDKMLYESNYLGEDFHDFIVAYEEKCATALRLAGLIQ
jgi:putative tricarboxylic transport membrane protein